MKKTKIIVPAVALVVVFLIGMFVGIPIGRGSSNGENGNSSEYGGFEYEEPQTVTLKEYLDGGPRVGFLSSIPDKNSGIGNSMFVIENGLMYRITYMDIDLSWGEVSKMTDEELIEYIKNRAVEPLEYRLCIYTDRTGNNLEYEAIEFLIKDSNKYSSYYILNPYTYTAIVYDSVFQGFINTNDHSGTWFRVSDGITITLDNIGDEGVEVD